MLSHKPENFQTPKDIVLASENRPQAVSPKEAAKMLGIGRTKLYELLDARSLRSSKIGSRRLISIDAIRDCLAEHEAE